MILGHPNKKSFNFAIFERVNAILRKNGHRVFAHDLYREGFDPVIPGQELRDDAPRSRRVKRYCRELVLSDGMIFIHPNWWGGLPAVLKGYIDRVFRPGFAYRFSENDSGGGIPEGLFAGKTGIVFNTSNTVARREAEFFGDPLERTWKKCIFEFSGITNHFRKTYTVISDSTFEKRTEWLNDVETITAEYFPPPTFY